MTGIGTDASLVNSKIDVGNVNVLSASPTQSPENVSVMNHQLLQRVLIALEGDGLDYNRPGMVVEIHQLKTKINRLETELNSARRDIERMTLIVRWQWVALAIEPLIATFIYFLWTRM